MYNNIYVYVLGGQSGYLVLLYYITVSMQSHAEWTARMVQEGRKVGRRQKTTGYQKATHFELGSDEQW